MFFPHINALKSDEEKREFKTNQTLGFEMALTPAERSVCFADQNDLEGQNKTKKAVLMSSVMTPGGNGQTSVMSQTSIRKSHQNFRILQVLEYYLKL